MNKQIRKTLDELRDRLQTTLDDMNEDVIDPFCDQEEEVLKAAPIPADLFARIAKWVSTVEDVCSEVSDIKSEEQDKFDNMPVGLQANENGTNLEEIVEYLDSAEDSANSAVSALTGKFANLNDLVGSVQSAIGDIEEVIDSIDNAACV